MHQLMGNQLFLKENEPQYHCLSLDLGKWDPNWSKMWGIRGHVESYIAQPRGL